jgi:hypothetical protein
VLHEKTPRQSGQSFELKDGDCLGHAQVVSENPHLFQLRSTREADGAVLICVITYENTGDLDWALALWKSIRTPERH